MRIFTTSRENGSALLTSLTLVGVMSLTLASYLQLVKQEQLSMSRSLAWNSALPIAEAGVEEALTQINSHDSKLVADNGWTLSGSYLTKTKTLGTNSWSVGISTSLPPVIVAQGGIRAPLRSENVSRIIRVITRQDPYFSRGMVAKGTIDLKGNGVTVDSYDSSDPTASTDGQWDPAKRRAHGSVATTSSLTDSLNSGNANIWGTLATGAGGTVKLGANGVVGDSTWHNSGANGAQPGTVTDDVNVSFPDVQVPSACLSAFAPGTGTVNGTNYDYVLNTGYYVLSGSKQLGGKVMVTGNAVLLVKSDVQFSGQDFIYIQPGASLELYVSSPNANLGGQGIFNPAGTPSSFLYYGLPTNTSLSYGGNATVSAAIYAPEADFTLGGGGNNDTDFSGACVTRTIKLNGHFNFHFDEALSVRRIKGWIANSWDEIQTPVATIVANNLNPATL